MDYFQVVSSSLGFYSLQLCLAFLCLLSLSFWFLKRKTQANNYWPFLATLPSLLYNANRLPEWFTENFISLGRASFFIDGPVFSNPKYLVTCHPQNLEYILKTNFNNFHKGPDFKEMFDPLGDGILNADGESWHSQRKTTHTHFSSVEFRSLVTNESRRVVDDELIPFLTHAARQGSTIDLQEVCRRITYDSTMSVFLGREEAYLSIDLPANELAEAGDDAQEALLYRIAMPMLWKLLRWLRVGAERKLYKACRIVHVLFSEYISVEREKEKLNKGMETTNLLLMYIKSPHVSSKSETFLIDTMVNLSTASRDRTLTTLSWFLWLVAKTPCVEVKILEEQKFVVSNKKNKSEVGLDDHVKQSWVVFDSDDLKGLVYLHAALCESMRLYPPLPLKLQRCYKTRCSPRWGSGEARNVYFTLNIF